MMEILKKNMNILIIALYGYILFYKIKKDDYVCMVILTLFTAVLIMQLRKSSYEGFDKDNYVEDKGVVGEKEKGDYVKGSGGDDDEDDDDEGGSGGGGGTEGSTGENKKKAFEMPPRTL